MRRSGEKLAIYVLFKEFNLYKKELKYDELVFSMCFFMNDLGKIKYIVPDTGTAKRVNPQFALFISYLQQVGTRSGNEFYLPHSSLNFVIENVKDLQKVCYREPVNLIGISTEIRAPQIKVTQKNDTQAFIEIEEGFEIIYGKFLSYAMFNNTLYILPEDFPLPFYRFIGGKSTTVDIKHIPEALASGYKPALTPGRGSKTVSGKDADKDRITNVTVNPETKVYIGKCNESGEIYLRPVIRYGSYLDVGIGGSYKQGDHYMVAIDGRSYRVKRNEIKEILLLNQLNKHSYYLTWCDDRYICCREDSARVLLDEILPGLRKDSEIVFEDGLEKLTVRRGKIKVDMTVGFNHDNGLFEFDMVFHCDNLHLSPGEILELVKKGRSYLVYGYDYIEVGNRGEIQKLLSMYIKSGDYSVLEDNSRVKFRLTPAKTACIESTLAGCKNVAYTGDMFYERFNDAANRKKLLEEVPIENELLMILRDYQVKGVNWIAFLREYGLGGILADDMGLGKTLQVLTALIMCKGKGASIVICPKTLVYNWYEEIKKFTPGLKVLIPEGNARQRKLQIETAGDYDVLITSYSLIRNDLENYLDSPFKYCILDEAQHIKNPDAGSTKSVKKLKAGTRLALTGTPVENSLLELWSIFDFLMPGFLGSRREFNEEFGESPGLLRERVKPFILRRTKKEALSELPPKIEQIQYAAMEHEQLAMYLSILDSAKENVFETVEKDGFEKSRIQILAALTRLRQICNHPGLVNEKFLKHKNVSAKLELFEELVNDCIESGHKILVFSQFTKMLAILADKLNENNIRFSYLDGSSENRGSIIKEFSKDENIKVFLISLKAGGYGLNLTSADTVILFDPWWNPMVENQAIDRVYRLGQEKPVNVYRLITRGTIEEKIQALKQRKQALFDAVINETGEFIEKLAWEDIKQLFI